MLPDQHRVFVCAVFGIASDDQFAHIGKDKWPEFILHHYHSLEASMKWLKGSDPKSHHVLQAWCGLDGKRARSVKKIALELGIEEAEVQKAFRRSKKLMRESVLMAPIAQDLRDLKYKTKELGNLSEG